MDFNSITAEILRQSRGENGIGTLGEHSLHAVLKAYFCPDLTKTEVKIGRYVADICIDDHIVEIQTRALWRLRDKLNTFTQDHTVTVVFPIAVEKYVAWIDPETGTIGDRRKSPKHGTIYDAIPELYDLRGFIGKPGFSVKLVLLNMNDYRLKNGRGNGGKRGSSRFERIPTALLDEIDLVCTDDYMMMLPADLPDRFTAKDYAKSTKLRLDKARKALALLFELGIAKRVERNKNGFLYECAK